MNDDKPNTPPVVPTNERDSEHKEKEIVYQIDEGARQMLNIAIFGFPL